MSINPENITTIRVDQLNSIGLTLESLFPHTNGTELTSSSIGDLATLVATTIESLNGIGFLPISVTDGQQLPDLPENPVFFLAGAGTYLNVNGFPDLICTENLNAIMSVTDHWEIAVEIPVNPLTGSVQSVTGSAVDNTDPLNPVINLSSAVTSVNGLTGAVVVDGDNIDVTDPTTSTDSTLNDALANIYASSGGGSVTSVNGDTGVVVVDLQSAIDEGNTITDGTDTNTITANKITFSEDGEDVLSINKADKSIVIIDLITSNSANITPDGISFDSSGNTAVLSSDKITVNSVDYPLPTGASSQIATLADITGGVSDGDKGDITVSSSGTVWTIDNGVVDNAKVASGIDAVKIADGSVSNTEFQYINSLRSNAQTQIDEKQTNFYKDVATSTPVTGTTSNTILISAEILANTFTVGTLAEVRCNIQRSGANGNATFRIYTNTSNSLTGATLLATYTNISTQNYTPFKRLFAFKTGDVIFGAGTTLSLANDEVVSGAVPSSNTFDPTVSNWIIIAVQPSNASDSFTSEMFVVKGNR